MKIWVRQDRWMDAATVHRLTEPAGQRLLELISTQWTSETVDPLTLAARLRRDHNADLVAAAMTVIELRRHGARKLGAHVGRLVMDRPGLEQATRRSVAEHRAGRLAEVLAAAGARPRVVDLGCGIGVDLIAMARAGFEVTGVDHDPARVAMARANLAALGLPGAVRLGDVTDTAVVDPSDFEAAFCDPARRDGTGRRFDPGSWSPPWSWIEPLLVSENPVAVVKTAPGIPHALVPPGVQAEWVSDGGDLVEAALWGAAARPAVLRRATLLPSDVRCTDADLPADDIGAGPMRSWLYEPDDAVIRAGLVQVVGGRVRGQLLDPHLAYITADSLVSTPLARAYRVLEEVPHRERALRQVLRARGIGRLTIKRRGVEVTAEQLRRRLAAAGALRGDESGTLVLTRVAGRGSAFLVEPAAAEQTQTR